MKRAVLVAPSDACSPDHERCRQGISRVTRKLEALGFSVVCPEATEGLEEAFARALNDVATNDDVLVHVSGRLVQSGVVLRMAGGKGLPLRRLGDLLGSRPGGRLWVIAELVREDELGPGLTFAKATEHVVTYLGVRERGEGAIAAQRASSSPADSLAFTQLLLDVAQRVAGKGEMTLAKAYEQAVALPAGRAATDGCLLVAGAADLSLVTVPPDPLDPETHANAFAHHMADGHSDAAFLAALALEELGVLSSDHRALLRQFRSVAPIRARQALDSDAWDLLRVPGSNDALADILRVVARAAIDARLDQLVERKRLVALDPASRLDQTSTASIVRSFQWSARVLGAVCPALYVLAEVPGEIAAVRAREPSTAVALSVVSGRSAKDLAFLAGRHLTYYRPEHQVVVYYPTPDDLLQLVLATKHLVSTGPSAGEGGAAAVGLAARMGRYIVEEERTALAGLARERVADRDSADLRAWARGVELTAARAGLFLSGDLATVMALVRRESRSIAGLSFEEKRNDLIAFCTSAAHVSLRDRFAVTEAQSPSSEPPRSNGRPGMPPEWRTRGAVD